jgi:hypothetical protein
LPTGYYRKFIKGYAQITTPMENILKTELRHTETENGYCAYSGIDHPLAFASRKLSTTEINYTTTEREGLAMVYALQKFRHYLLGGHFKMFTDHSVLKYLVNKPVLGGRICRWLLLFQEYDFEIVVKPGRMNKGPDHLSRLEHGEEPTSLEDTLPDAQLLAIRRLMITSSR